MGRRRVQQPDVGGILGGIVVLVLLVGFARTCGDSKGSASSQTYASPSTSSPPREAEKPQPTLWVNTQSDPLVLRASPAADAPVLATMPRATQVETTGETSGRFTSVSYGGQQGWAATQYLSNSAVVSPVSNDNAARVFIPYEGNGRGPTQCADGTWSRSSGRGTCSHHGGIR